MKLADAITNGGVDEVSAAVNAVVEALDTLAASAKGQADALIGASPLADLPSKDALVKAVNNLEGADDVIMRYFHWEAREGNTVDVFYALTDTDAQATGGFTQIASRQGPSGSVGIPKTCPVGPGPLPYITVKAVASNANGSATSYYWGL
ncbi:hypothetical protein J7E29_10325 [Streptomyces sp. ISL-90]|nr:hypothetical protein [Streptomyces sp. ISL-90]